MQYKIDQTDSFGKESIPKFRLRGLIKQASSISMRASSILYLHFSLFSFRVRKVRLCHPFEHLCWKTTQSIKGQSLWGKTLPEVASLENEFIDCGVPNQGLGNVPLSSCFLCCCCCFSKQSQQPTAKPRPLGRDIFIQLLDMPHAKMWSFFQ